MGEIVEEFIRAFSEEYKTESSLVRFLIQSGLIKQKTIRNYQIVKEYYFYLKENDGYSTKAVMDLSIKYDMSERQVQNILYTYRQDHKEVI